LLRLLDFEPMAEIAKFRLFERQAQNQIDAGAMSEMVTPLRRVGCSIQMIRRRNEDHFLLLVNFYPTKKRDVFRLKAKQKANLLLNRCQRHIQYLRSSAGDSD
jgi:hypothetical protein